ncbi:hypothetical protein GMRT_14389 [Giardia muris]|uniref:Uncharacterized protein n=1 Tax=Giardia muris TaxID=5742 RepID=A0A4Z1T567_GIAMU|nr:hypothetical protein GMRT_14389 [Giardia muris]|eukprot:TNJ28237.1 hypothetical protein GMRT_14389 [Giardia muris]
MTSLSTSLTMPPLRARGTPRSGGCPEGADQYRPNVADTMLFPSMERKNPTKMSAFDLPDVIKTSLDNYEHPKKVGRTRPRRQPDGRFRGPSSVLQEELNKTRLPIKEYVRSITSFNIYGESLAPRDPEIIQEFLDHSNDRKVWQKEPPTDREKQHARAYASTFDKTLMLRLQPLARSCTPVLEEGRETSFPASRSGVPGGRGVRRVAKGTGRPTKNVLGDGINKAALALDSSMSTITNIIDKKELINLISVYHATRQTLQNDLVVKEGKVEEMRLHISRLDTICAMHNPPSCPPRGQQCYLRLPCRHYFFAQKEKYFRGELCRVCNAETEDVILINLDNEPAPEEPVEST